MKLLISGATGNTKQCHLPYRLTPDLQKHTNGEAALWMLDTEAGWFSTYYQPDPEEVRSFPRAAPPGPMSLDRFTGLCEYDGRYFATTFNEVLVIEKGTGRLIDVHSQPSFNDLHCCFAWEGGQAVANTGMDCIELFDHAWQQVGRVRLAGTNDIDGRDWRQVPSTKPHACHVNWLFMLGGELWCTRYVQRDAVKVHDPTERMDIGYGMPHDGLVRDGRVLFTSAEGKIVAHQAAGRREQSAVLDLEDMVRPFRTGWVRGLHFTGDDFYVGTTRLRYTTSRKVLNWVLSKPRNYSNSAVLRVRAGDGKLVSVWEMPHPCAVVFSLLAA